MISEQRLRSFVRDVADSSERAKRADRDQGLLLTARLLRRGRGVIILSWQAHKRHPVMFRGRRGLTGFRSSTYVESSTVTNDSSCADEVVGWNLNSRCDWLSFGCGSFTRNTSSLKHSPHSVHPNSDKATWRRPRYQPQPRRIQLTPIGTTREWQHHTKPECGS